VLLAAVVAALGPALKLIPLPAIQLVVGALLLAFGRQWLRKAMLGAAGIKAEHDEGAIYERQVLKASGIARRASAFDSYSFRILFMGVLLEGSKSLSSCSRLGPPMETLPWLLSLPARHPP
jgi:uncharacterized membrane protein